MNTPRPYPAGPTNVSERHRGRAPARSPEPEPGQPGGTIAMEVWVTTVLRWLEVAKPLFDDPGPRVGQQRGGTRERMSGRSFAWSVYPCVLVRSVVC
jgi:hypothetical protein